MLSLLKHVPPSLVGVNPSSILEAFWLGIILKNSCIVFYGEPPLGFVVLVPLVVMKDYLVPF